MRRNRVACVLFALACLTPTAATAQDSVDLSEISAQVDQYPILRAEFRQERQVRALSRPLVSQGRLLFVSGKGVLWQVTEPQAAVLLVEPGKAIEFADGKARASTIGESPVFRSLVEVFLAALSGTLDGLARNFEIVPARGSGGWHLTLTPKTPDLAKVISSIELEGASFIETIRIAEASGDGTVISLSEFKTEPAELDDEEKAYFGD